jgi:hypothetical protein
LSRAHNEGQVAPLSPTEKAVTKARRSGETKEGGKQLSSSSRWSDSRKGKDEEVRVWGVREEETRGTARESSVKCGKTKGRVAQRGRWWRISRRRSAGENCEIVVKGENVNGGHTLQLRYVCQLYFDPIQSQIPRHLTHQPKNAKVASARGELARFDHGNRLCVDLFVIYTLLVDVEGLQAQGSNEFAVLRRSKRVEEEVEGVALREPSCFV